MPEWRPVCADRDLPADSMQRFTLAGDEITLIRVGDELYAVDDTCTHGAVSLSEGELITGERPRVECWLHGSEFDLSTGQPTCLPATVALRTYPVRIVEDTIEIGL
ncbi:MAG: non-heme iron oxygenase ferredoxin subunit [Actinomycetales bacterium]|nr:non-heme iron oxygenase ferredoxin subunit [Actinomycetales bacterium]